MNKQRSLLRFVSILAMGILISSLPASLFAQDSTKRENIDLTWPVLQMLPSLNWTSFSDHTQFAFEWEAAPILYSWGMSKLDSRWHFIRVSQPERFAGSIELVVSAQVYMHKVGTSHWGFSGQLVGHFPLIERGEYLGLNIGAARYNIAGVPSDYIIGGVSTLFGFIHYNVRYSPSDKIWINAIEFRFF